MAIIAVCVIAVIGFTIMGKQVEAIVSIALALIGVVGYYAKNKNTHKGNKGGQNIDNSGVTKIEKQINIKNGLYNEHNH